MAGTAGGSDRCSGETGVKGIFGEKPMAASLGQADAMIAACEENDVKLIIGHQGRYAPANIETRRLVAAGAIGEPTTVHHSAKKHAGLLNTGTHAIDGWRFMLSDPETLWVIGQTARTTDRWERRTICEDLCMGLVCFEGGARGIYEGDLPEPSVSMPNIAGTEGQIVTDLTAHFCSKTGTRRDGKPLRHPHKPKISTMNSSSGSRVTFLTIAAVAFKHAIHLKS